MANRQFYIAHRNPNSAANLNPGKLPLRETLVPAGEVFEVHLLNDQLRTTSKGYLAETHDQLVINRITVPSEVLAALKQLSPNTAIFVDETGREIDPF